MAANTLHAHKVWDVPTRLFHWINFVCVVALAAIGTAILYGKDLGLSDDGKVLLKATHVYFGYVFALNLAWRLVWAFIGNRHARWSKLHPFQRDFIPEAKTHLNGMWKGNARPYLGHNPIARATIFVLLILLVVQACTGLILAGTDIYYPPFGYWIASWIAAPGVDPSLIQPYNKTGIDPASWDAMRSFRSPIITTHYWVFYALLTVIAIHVAGVVITELREQGSIVSAMITGRKVLDQQPVDEPGHDA